MTYRKSGRRPKMPGMNPLNLQIETNQPRKEMNPPMTEEQRYRYEERIGILTADPTREPTPEEIRLALIDSGIIPEGTKP